jgi:hypothetical protein
MPYPQITEYLEAVQHPQLAFVDPELKQGMVAENNLGLPLVMSGGFALTYAVTTRRRKCAVRCFHREIPAIQQKYEAISKKLGGLPRACFVDFEFQPSGITVRQNTFPIVRMDWVEGDTLGVWLDKHIDDPRGLEKARAEFAGIARFLAQNGIAHGDIQNGNVMVENGALKLIDYDGMFVPGMRPGDGSETGHRHFQHPERRVSHFGPEIDRFSFIALDLSLRAVVEDKSLYPKFREGGETIIFKANDFADPEHSEIFGRLSAMPKLKDQARNFAAICQAPLAAAPTLDDFLSGRNIPAAKTPITTSAAPKPKPQAATYLPAYPVVDALDFSSALQRIGDRVELVGRIVEVKPGSRKRGKGSAKHFIFINFGSSRGNVVRISIWSEGLARMKERPSKGWIGRWVSVTGLMEVAYQNKRYGLKHLSITVHDDGQIQEIKEAEAGFRLASMAKADVAPGLLRPAGAATTPAAVAKPKTTRPSRSKSKRAAKPQPASGPAVPGPAAPTPAAPQQTARRSWRQSWRQLAAIPRWVWVAAALLIIAAALGAGANQLRTIVARAAPSGLAAETALAASTAGTPAEAHNARHASKLVRSRE